MEQDPKNKHVKKIKGRLYYYESIRDGKKVKSRYIEPVKRIRKKKTFTKKERMEYLKGKRKEPFKVFE